MISLKPPWKKRKLPAWALLYLGCDLQKVRVIKITDAGYIQYMLEQDVGRAAKKYARWASPVDVREWL